MRALWSLAAIAIIAALAWWVLANDAEVEDRPRPPPKREAGAAPRKQAAEAIPPVLDDVETTSVAAPDQIRAALAETFRGRYPERNVTDLELDRMTAALARLARARAAMNALQYDRSEGGELKRLRDEIGEAVAEFETVAGMPLSRFTEEATEDGISR